MVNSFEELKVWQEARTLTKTIYKISSEGKFSRDFGLRDQIRRAATSTMLNIAEGFDSATNKQFVQFLSYTRRSCSEIQSVLYIALDNQYITTNDFKALYERANTVRKMSVGLIKYLSNNSKLTTRNS